VGPMNVRLRALHEDIAAGNYVKFLTQIDRPIARAAQAAIYPVANDESAMSGLSLLWANLGGGSPAEKTEKQRAQVHADLTYLYSAFTKIPCLRLAPDSRARLIEGYEEFPFDTALPLQAFKNISALEIIDIDFRQFYGWNRLADQLRSLTVKRAGLDDPVELLINIVLDDMGKRRGRPLEAQLSRTRATPYLTPKIPRTRRPSISNATMETSDSMPDPPATRRSDLD
jgi:hypothetical protein